jgi:hypothetical protein
MVKRVRKQQQLSQAAETVASISMGAPIQSHPASQQQPASQAASNKQGLLICTNTQLHWDQGQTQPTCKGPAQCPGGLWIQYAASGFTAGTCVGTLIEQSTCTPSCPPGTELRGGMGMLQCDANGNLTEFAGMPLGSCVNTTGQTTGSAVTSMSGITPLPSGTVALTLFSDSACKSPSDLGEASSCFDFTCGPACDEVSNEGSGSSVSRCDRIMGIDGSVDLSADWSAGTSCSQPVGRLTYKLGTCYPNPNPESPSNAKYMMYEDGECESAALAVVPSVVLSIILAHIALW